MRLPGGVSTEQANIAGRALLSICRATNSGLINLKLTCILEFERRNFSMGYIYCPAGYTGPAQEQDIGANPNEKYCAKARNYRMLEACNKEASAYDALCQFGNPDGLELFSQRVGRAARWAEDVCGHEPQP